MYMKACPKEYQWVTYVDLLYFHLTLQLDALDILTEL